ncbi:hypothetical protein GQ600_132 [Phytophthora cactorum]|nr:hypothetical protein GQ600_132 [Phytophthora cactorum]
MRKNLAFLQKTFTSDVAMGKLSGIDELINQWRRYSQYFGDARLHLQRLESMAPGVMKATARLHVTIQNSSCALRSHIYQSRNQSANMISTRRCVNDLKGSTLTVASRSTFSLAKTMAA